MGNNELKGRRRILVTGGCGFIGSALVRRLVGQEECDVLNIDKLTYASQVGAVAVVESSPRYAFKQLDICNGPELSDAIMNFEPDTIMHLAAETHVDRSIDSPAPFVETNVQGTMLMLDTALTYWQTLSNDRRDAFRFVHVSTDEVYGSLELEGDRRFRIGDPYEPNSPYAASKASADHLVRAWHQTYGLPTIISNCSNNFGPWQFPEKMIPKMILSGLFGDPMPVYGKGANIRDWLHVDDHVLALIAIAARGKPGAQYMAGGFGAMDNLSLVHLLCDILDEHLPNSPHNPHRDLIRFVDDRPGHDLRYDVDSERLQKELGWQPQYSPEEGLRQTVAWYLDNRAWCDAHRHASGQRRRGLIEKS